MQIDSICKHCGKKMALTFLKKRKRPNRKGTDVYLDENGTMVYGKSRCNLCFLAHRRKRLGIKSRSESDSLKMKKEVARESAVVEYFLRKGKDAVLGHGRGPDVIFWENGERKTCEVKPVKKSSKGDSWYVCAVMPRRINDDFIAMLFPTGDILLEKMGEHLEKCTKGSGIRRLTVEKHLFDVCASLGLKNN